MQAYARTAARRAGPVVAGAAAALTVNDEAHDANSDASAPSDASSDRFKRLQSRFEDVCGDLEVEKETVMHMYLHQDRLMSEIDRLKARNRELQRRAQEADAAAARRRHARPNGNGGNTDALDWWLAVGAGILGAVAIVAMVVLKGR